MASHHVLCIPRTDTENLDEYVTINATLSGPTALDLVLEGTEGDMAYYAIFSASQLASARAPKSPISVSEWQATLLSTFAPQHHPPSIPSTVSSSPSPEVSPILTTSASVSSRGISITLRHTYSGITQRLGELLLPADPDHEVDTLAWVSTSIQRVKDLSVALEASREKERTQADVIGKFQARFEELRKEKEDGEKRLLGTCEALLNGKKAKIRELMRVLGVRGSADVDGRNVRIKARESPAPSKAGSQLPKRARKRKPPKEVSEESESDGFEVGRGAHMPERSEDEAETEDGTADDADAADEVARAPQAKAKIGVLGMGREKGITRESGEIEAESLGKKQEKKEPDDPPPRRDLPFVRTGAAVGAETTKDKGKEMPSGIGDVSMEDEDTESDDEL